jgi:hypothetical protein
MALGFHDNPGNILGADTAANQYSSTNVTADADGSVIERLEYIQAAVAAAGLAPGCFAYGEAAADTASTTEIVVADLAGYGDDFFNNKYYMQILHNADSAGDAPEAQVRKITDYVSATGTFTVDAFSANVGQDLCVILHESLVILGRDDNNNVFASTNVVANADGSVIERLEYLQGLVGGVDGAANILGANDADNQFDSSTVAANADGSIVERLEYIQGDLGAAVGASLSADIAAVKAETAIIKANPGMGVANVIIKAVTFSNTAADVNLFTVTGDVIARIVAVCKTACESAAGCNVSVAANSVAIIASTDVTTLEAGDIWHDNSPDSEVEALSDAMKERVITDGNDIVFTVQAEKQVDSGAITFYFWYVPLSANGAVAAA